MNNKSSIVVQTYLKNSYFRLSLFDNYYMSETVLSYQTLCFHLTKTDKTYDIASMEHPISTDYWLLCWWKYVLHQSNSNKKYLHLLLISDGFGLYQPFLVLGFKNFWFKPFLIVSLGNLALTLLDMYVGLRNVMVLEHEVILIFCQFSK